MQKEEIIMKLIKSMIVLLIAALIIVLPGCANTPQTPVPASPVPPTETAAPAAEPEAVSEPQTESEGAAEPAAAVSDAAAPDASDAAPAEEAAAAVSAGEALHDKLVIFFSRTGEQYTVGVIEKGNTSIVAEMIAETVDADLFEVIPVDDHYPMTYNALTDIARQEQNTNARPEYAGALPDLAQYDTIFIGAPVWWGDWPMIMYTLFENNDFSGKKLVPFSTHEGSGLSGFDRKLAAACPNSEILTGLAVRGNDCQNKQGPVRQSVEAWLAGLGF